jgi:hypothetical protein
MPRIPTYQSKVQPRQSLNAPFQSGSSAARTAQEEQRFAGAIVRAGNMLQKVANKRQARLNAVMVSDTYAQLQKASFDQLQAATSLKGKDALNAFDDYKKWFDNKKQSLSKNLENDRQREIFSAEIHRLEESRYRAVSRHQSHEERVYQTSVYNSNMALLANEFQSQPFDDKALSQANARMMGLTAVMHPGENVAAINMANDQKMQTLRVRAMIEKNPERAVGYIEKLKPRLGKNYFQLKRANTAAIDKAVGNSLYSEFKTAGYLTHLDQAETLSREVQEETFDPFKPIIEPDGIPDFNSARQQIEADKRLSLERKRQVIGWINQDESKYIRLQNANEQAVFENARNTVGEFLLDDNIQEAYQIVEDSGLPDWTKLNLKEFIQARDQNAPSINNLVETMGAIENEEITKESEIKSLKAVQKLNTDQASAAIQYLKERNTDDAFYIKRSLDLFNKTFPKDTDEALYKPDFEIWLRKKALSGVNDIQLYEEAKKYLAGAAPDWNLFNPFSWGSGDSEFQKDIEGGKFNPKKEGDIPPEIKDKILQDIADTPGLEASQEVIDFVYQRKYKGQDGQSD